MTILDRLRTFTASASVPRPVRSVVASAAIAWGTLVASSLAQECGEEISAAEGRLEDLNAAVLERETHLERLMTELEKTPGRHDRLKAAHLVGAGDMDAVVKARAAGLGWAPPVDVNALVDYVKKDAQEVELRAGDVMWVNSDVAAAIRFYFSAAGPGGGLPDIDEPVELVDEPVEP